MYALLSNQGTAMHETALSSVEFFDNRGTRERAERDAPADAMRPLQWADVSANGAFEPSEEELAEWMETIHFSRTDERSCTFGAPKSFEPRRVTFDPNEVTCKCCKSRDTFVLSPAAVAMLSVAAFD